MYKTEVITGVKKTKEKAIKIAELINLNEKEGWSFISSINNKADLILIFQESSTYQLNKNLNDGIENVKKTFKKVVDKIT